MRPVPQPDTDESLRRPDVRLIPFRLKRVGRLTGAGLAFTACIVAFSLFFAHSAFIRYHEVRGQHAFEAVRAAVERRAASLPKSSIRSAVTRSTRCANRGVL